MIGQDSIKEQIRQRIDLVDFISRDVALKRKGRDFGGLCPFHQEKTPSFYVSPEKGIFKCFGCGAGGDLFSYVQRRENVPFPEVIRMLADQCGIELRKETPNPSRSPQPTRHDIFKVNQWAANFFERTLADESSGAAARQYVQDRMISDDMIAAFGLGLAIDDFGRLVNQARSAGIDERTLLAAGLAKISDGANAYDVFRHRLIFPIRDTMNRVLGFGGRTLGDDKAKYLNTAQNPVFDKRRLLYGIDLARESLTATRRAIVVEGYTDCIAAHQFGFTNTVATLGTALTDEHVSLLRRWCNEIVLVFDSDAAGQQAADRAVEVALRFDISVRIVRLSDGKDPCDYLHRNGAEGFESLLNGAIEALRFRWEALSERYQAGASAGGRSGAVREFVDLAGDLVRRHALDPIERGLIVNQLSRLMGVSAGEVNQLLKAASRKAAKRTQPPTAPGIKDAPRDSKVGADDEVLSGEIRDQADQDRSAKDPIVDEAEQAALDTILAVLVNEPGHFSAAESVLDADRCVDARRKRVAGVVVQLCRELGEFSVAEIMDRLDDPGDAQWVTDLVYRGQSVESYEQTMTGCIARLNQIESQRRVRQAADRITCSTGDEQLDELARISRDQVNANSFGGRQVHSAWTNHCVR